MPESNESQSDAFEAAREGALSWLTANWDPKLTVREWWARLADSGWGFPTWPAEWFGKGMSAEEAAGVRAAFAETGHKLPHAFFRHQKVRGEDIGPNLDQIRPFSFAADMALLGAVKQDMPIFVAP